jgi:2-iminobutanoate/2-iminopropanoate deaminase
MMLRIYQEIFMVSVDSVTKTVQKTEIISPRLFKALGPYSHCVKVTGAQTLVFTSTVTAIDCDWNVIGVGDIRAQTRKTIENLKIALAEAGASLKDVVKVNWYLVNIEHFKTVLEVREELFEGHRPASGTIPINRLALPELLLEADATAVL